MPLRERESREREREREQNEERGDARIDEGLRQKLEGLVPEILKRTFYAGLGAVFTTEEGVRRLATEFSLPKDVVSFLLQQAQGTKKELFRMVAQEVRGFLESLNLTEEMQRLLTSLSFEIKTEIRFIPNDARVVKPQMKNKVTVRKEGGDKRDGDPEGGPDEGGAGDPDEAEE